MKKRAEIINIGDELLIGQVINTNASWLANELNKIGIHVNRIIVIPDKKETIIQALNESENRSDLIIITGGLGPTKDDLTKHTLCEYFQTSLIQNEDVLKDVTMFFEMKKLPMIASNIDQALVPANCTVLRNPCGTAPGMWFEKNNHIFISLPGVPYEMKDIFNQQISSKLQTKWALPPLIHKTILTIGIGESFLSEKISDWENNLPETIRLAYLPSAGIVKLRLSAFAEFQDRLLLEKQKLENQIKEYIFGYDEDTLQTVIGALLKKNQKTLSTAESCTGGYIAHLITLIAGSSAYFKGSVIAYSNEIKMNELAISKDSLVKEGAVSESVVKEMAQNCRKKFNTDYAISVSGIAGPDGGTPDKPVGTVWIGISTPDKTITQKFLFTDNRERNIQRSAHAALNLLFKELK